MSGDKDIYALVLRLAEAVQKGFETVNRNFELVNKNAEGVNSRLDKIEGKVDNVLLKSVDALDRIDVGSDTIIQMLREVQGDQSKRAS